MAKLGLQTLVLLSSMCARYCGGLSDCASTTPGGIFLNISSSKNDTGHWNAQVHFRHGAGANDTDHTENDVWDVEVTQTTEKCKEGNVVDIMATVTAFHAIAAAGYEHVPRLGYYKLHTTPRNWLDARDICQKEGGHLAIVNSEKELNALHGILSLHPKIVDGWQNYVAYVGFHDLFEEGEYITVFGDSLESTGYALFSPGEPTDKAGTTGEDCGCIGRNEQLNDVVCTERLPFFCERETL